MGSLCSWDGESLKGASKTTFSAMLIAILSRGLERYDPQGALILQAFTESGDLDVDERKLEGLHYGYMKWEMVS